ncbi:MAG TPA: cation/H(+) antiporter, partial [Algoriphagus sp.]|nr:cation/H(+) antiporter [Algoriphagus sp.]
METLNHKEVINLLLQLAAMLIMARVFAEIARKLKQPAVVGEILAGIVLGPTILGSLMP